MSWLAPLARIFNLRRISGQIAALVLISLVLIHVLIAGFIFVSRSHPYMMIDEPQFQLELISRIVARTPQDSRPAMIDAIRQAYPDLHLDLVRPGEALSDGDRAQSYATIPWSPTVSVDIAQQGPPTERRAIVDFHDGDRLKAIVRKLDLPEFLTGLWAGTLLFLLVSTSLLGIWAGRALARPLSAFAKAAESFSLSRSPEPLNLNGPDEIRSAAKALNVMRERVTSLMNDRTRMLAAISHDLRTPITRLRLRAEYIEDNAQRLQTVQDLDQMRSMLDSVLTFLRGEDRASPVPVDVGALLQVVCDLYAEDGHAVDFEGLGRLIAVVRPDEVQRAVSNVVDNALRYATQVVVTLSSDGTNAIIAVADDGPGIPDDQKLAMLEPFVRGSTARTMDEKSGFGLGLSITHGIVQAHGGTLRLDDNAPRGLRVVIKIPIGQQATNGMAA